MPHHYYRHAFLLNPLTPRAQQLPVHSFPDRNPSNRYHKVHPLHSDLLSAMRFLGHILIVCNLCRPLEPDHLQFSQYNQKLRTLCRWLYKSGVLHIPHQLPRKAGLPINLFYHEVHSPLYCH